MVKGISIVLCTYNGKKRLEQTLQHIAAQKITVPCEIIFVDNASTDDTKEYADTWWKTHGASQIEYYSFIQPIPGKSYAQDLGYEKAQYEYILVCDDDNWLCDIYVETAYQIMTENTSIGALGGWCDAVFELEKPAWFSTYSKYFAVSKQGKQSGDITNQKGCLYGAGMVLRKSHWLQLKTLGFNHLLSCRKGDSLSSGGDTEYSYALRLLGYKIWYDERLYFKHFMTDGRLNLNYLSRLRKAMVYSNHILWPYQDLLKGKERTALDFKKEVFQHVPIYFTKKILNLCIGNFEKKEISKKYLINSKYKLFNYATYKQNLQSIKAWLPNKF
ncbi:glycosyltransferase [Oceanihabitans sp. 2_MG-2023]|uniref:glycosyltransferase n=1 Tax=Oceanihabitans sp. 2_MG-2023 TaxID=3062661 RepID=UPI0026E2EF2D|nr:glycosyltransferase [Oceanihabitans sp. 2_MG-2023]MDO6597685.1 glycosyltransferase [Oceanihabitans sp. 2_MG-2023]